ncbi:hypothetical protein GOBAR_DD11120 [Gossypium barbadense]|nr:hypothetical protein GOBAR_DD11120 [Gossypium barbadense]
MAVSKGRRNTAHMVHLSSNGKGIERVWVNAAAARRRPTFCNAFEVVVQYGLIKKAPKIQVKSLAETIIGVVEMLMADLRCRYRQRLLAVAAMVALLAGIIQDGVE